MVTFDKRLKGIITKAGLLDADKVDAAIAKASSQKRPLSQVLVESKLVDEKVLIGTIAKEMNIPPIDLSKVEVSSRRWRASRRTWPTPTASFPSRASATS